MEFNEATGRVAEAQIKEALQSGAPHLYVNGFAMALGASDVIASLVCSGQPRVVLNMSFTTAKTLAGALTAAIGHLERVTGQEIMEIEYIDQKIKGSLGEAPHVLSQDK